MKKAERRAFRGRDAWHALVAEWKASGKTAMEFARERDLSAASLFYWSSALRRESTPRPSSETMKLLPVQVTPSVVGSRTAELELAVGQVRVRFDDGASPQYVAALAQALLDSATP